jgi:hypothetical protein
MGEDLGVVDAVAVEPRQVRTASAPPWPPWPRRSCWWGRWGS